MGAELERTGGVELGGGAQFGPFRVDGWGEWAETRGGD